MDAQHPTAAGRFPPDDATLAGDVMLRLARGSEDADDVREHVTDVVDAGDLAASYPDEPDLSLEEALAIVDEVVAEHDRLVPTASRDTVALLGAFEELVRRGIAVSFGEGWDAGEGAEAGYAAARRLGPGARGYVYAHTQDLDRMVLTGALLLGFSGMSAGLAEEAAAIGREVADTLRAAGLPVDWDGDPRARMVLEPLAWARPVADGRVQPVLHDVPYDVPHDVPDPQGGPEHRSWWSRLRGR